MNDRFPLVSIAMATFNGEKYLREQLDSILRQTHPAIEIIICDDCSTDTTPMILREYERNEPRIHVFYNEKNLGLVRNFEKALSLCNGEYVALSDQDDVWMAEKLETLLTHLDDAMLIHSDAILINDAGEIMIDSYTHYSCKNLRKDFKDYLLSNNVTGCTALFRRDLLVYGLPIPAGVALHDWWLALHAFHHGGIAYYEKPLIYYRQHSANQIGASNPDKIASFAQRSEDVKKYLLFLKAVRQTVAMDAEESRFIKSLIAYYEDFFSKTIRLRSFFFHLYYCSRFNRKNHGKYTLGSLLLSLFGLSLQKKLWKLVSK